MVCSRRSRGARAYAQRHRRGCSRRRSDTDPDRGRQPAGGGGSDSYPRTDPVSLTLARSLPASVTLARSLPDTDTNTNATPTPTPTTYRAFITVGSVIDADGNLDTDGDPEFEEDQTLTKGWEFAFETDATITTSSGGNEWEVSYGPGGAS